MWPVPYSKTLIPISINILWMTSPILLAITLGGIDMCTVVKEYLYKKERRKSPKE